MKFWTILAFCLLTFCLATEANARCGRAAGGLRGVARAPVAAVKALGERVRERKPVRSALGRLLGR